MCIKFSMLCVRQVMNNLTEGQMLFSVIGESILKILESLPVVEKFMSEARNIVASHLTSTGIVHENRTDIFLKERKESKEEEERRGRKGEKVDLYFSKFNLSRPDFWGLNCPVTSCVTLPVHLGCSSLSLAGLEPEATMEVD